MRCADARINAIEVEIEKWHNDNDAWRCMHTTYIYVCCHLRKLLLRTRASENATVAERKVRSRTYPLTVWLTPHINTLSSGSFARNSLTFWCFTRKCFFFSLLSPLDICGALDMLVSVLQLDCQRTRICNSLSPFERISCPESSTAAYRAYPRTRERFSSVRVLLFTS